MILLGDIEYSFLIHDFFFRSFLRLNPKSHAYNIIIDSGLVFLHVINKCPNCWLIRSLNKVFNLGMEAFDLIVGSVHIIQGAITNIPAWWWISCRNISTSYCFPLRPRLFIILNLIRQLYKGLLEHCQ